MNTQTKQAKHPLIKHRQQRLADAIIELLEEDAAIKEELLEALQALIQAHQDGLPGLQTEQAFALCRKALAHATGE